MTSSLASTDRIVAVAVPVPGLGVLSYRIPPGLPMPAKGARVLVPLGPRQVTGCALGPASPDSADTRPLKDVARVLDDEAFLPSAVVDLALWVGEYYAAGPGSALGIAMPPAARRGAAHSHRTIATFRSVAPAPGAPRGDRQKQALVVLETKGAPVSMPELKAAGISRTTMNTLVERGFVEMRQMVVERDPFAVGGDHDEMAFAVGSTVPPVRTLTTEQDDALDGLRAAAAQRGFRTVLLHGVTGSGKTELYVRLARQVIEDGRRVLVLVPEIALTPAVAGLLLAHFGRRVAIQHSGLSAGERYDQWQRIRRGEVDVVVGTRSAVFAPLESLGLIVVDEEHESAYKQEDAPRYHGRDVAVVRGRLEQALVVLGSATPSLESETNARAGRYEVRRLTRRVLDRPLASVEIVDMRREYAARGPDVTLSQTLTTAIERRLAAGEQSLVLLNRRGFATVIFCRECGASVECPHCSVALTFHRARRQLRCHYCNYTTRVPSRCALCRGAFLEQSGFGTERLEADVRARFPGARIKRVDRDTVRRRGAIARVLRDVAAGHIDVLVGTQMIAKGHDFPAVTLVGVVQADVGLGLADFRAAERTFQLLTQVVGRAGRGDRPGEAVVQTLYPDHYSIRAAAAQDYETFYAEEMTFRKALRYPPVLALINVVIRGKTLDGALDDAQDVVDRLRKRGCAAKVLGPAPAAMAKVKDQYRAQFFIKGSQRTAMRQALELALSERPDLRRRTMVDVDPVSIL